MFNHSFFSAEANTNRKNYNIEKAKEAIAYTRRIIPVNASHTHPMIARDEALKLRKQILQNRRSLPTLHDSLYLILTKWDDFDKIKTKKWMRRAKISHQENCEALSCFSIAYLKKKNVARIERVTIHNSDHAFIVLDRAFESDINKKNWGKFCIVVDTLNNDIYGPEELYEKLNCYQFDKRSENPHILKPFTENNKLIIANSYASFISPQYNEKLLKQFFNKLKIIINAINDDYSNNNEAVKLKQKIEECLHQNYVNDVKDSSNFEMERLLDKKLRAIVRALAIIPDVNQNELCTDIIIKLSQCYDSYLEYFRDLIFLDTPFSHVMSHFKEYDSDVIKELVDQLDQDFLNELLSMAMNLRATLSVEALLQNGADPKTKDRDGDTVLKWAIKNKKLYILNYLLRNNENLFTTRDEENLLPIHHIAIYGFYKAVPWILNKYRNHIDVPAQNGMTPLHFAVRQGNIKTFKTLLEFGANPLLQENYGNLPIHCAAWNDRHEMLIILLDQYQSLLDAQNNEGQTALLIVAIRGHASTVKELLARGADPKIQSCDGLTPLMAAQASQSQDKAEMIDMLEKAIEKQEGKELMPYFKKPRI